MPTKRLGYENMYPHHTLTPEQAEGIKELLEDARAVQSNARQDQAPTLTGMRARKLELASSVRVLGGPLRGFRRGIHRSCELVARRLAVQISIQYLTTGTLI